MNYYITLEHFESNNQGEEGIPKGTLVKGWWDNQESYFKIERALFDPRKTNSITILGGKETRSKLREVRDAEIADGLRAIGVLPKAERM